MPEFRNREGVEIARVGTYKLSTGPFTFTREHLAAAVRNYTAGGAAPRLKAGHVDPRFDGEPALGTVTNLRLSDDGDVLVGDYANVPAALDDWLDSAYPGRSIEAAATSDPPDLRITHVALLGVTLPGIDSLADLPARFANGPLTLAAAQDNNGKTINFVIASTEEAADAVGRLIAASVNVDDLRSAFYDQRRPAAPPVCGDEWWVDEVHIDPNELIVKNGADVYRVPWSVADDGSYDFGDPIQVVVQYVDKVAASAGAVVAYRAGVSRPKNDPQEESTMDAKHLRDRLGLAEDATDEDVTAKLEELAGRPATSEVDDKVQEAVAAARQEEREKISASGGVVVDQATLDGLKADAQAGREARETQITASRESFIDEAIKTGKFPPARREHFVSLMAADETGTREYIDKLEAGVIPVDEIRGSGKADEHTDTATTTGWFSQLQEA
jgi:hypothetical protein